MSPCHIKTLPNNQQTDLYILHFKLFLVILAGVLFALSYIIF